MLKVKRSTGNLGRETEDAINDTANGPLTETNSVV